MTQARLLSRGMLVAELTMSGWTAPDPDVAEFLNAACPLVSGPSTPDPVAVIARKAAQEMKVRLELVQDGVAPEYVPGRIY